MHAPCLAGRISEAELDSYLSELDQEQVTIREQPTNKRRTLWTSYPFGRVGSPVALRRSGKQRLLFARMGVLYTNRMGVLYTNERRIWAR